MVPQAVETSHQDYEMLRTRLKMTRNMNHEDYEQFFKELTEIYNSENVGSKA